jgi:predicted alpha/beta-hydrolase family hydrolase
MISAVLVPGFNGRATQPLLVKLAAALETVGVKALRVELPRGRPSPGLQVEVEALRERCAAVKGPLVLIGRSFGGRVAARLVSSRDCAGLVLLGFPIRPPGKPRPDDVAALAAVRCPLLVVQGGKDPLGPLKVLKAAAPPHAQLEVLEGVGHSFGRHERAALLRVCAWVAALTAPAAPRSETAPRSPR